MNVAATTEKKPSLFVDSILSRVMPAHGMGRVFLWSFLPIVLLLANLGVAFFSICPYTKYLPFLTLVSILVTLCFRTWGLSVCYAAFLLIGFFCGAALPEETRLWQMGLLFSLAISIYTLLLAVEECEQSQEGETHSQVELRLISEKAASDLLQLKRATEEQEREFKEEIDRLKSEAELRRIERVDWQKKCELIQQEIELITAQKNEFIEETRAARREAAQSAHALEEQTKKLAEQQQINEEELKSLSEKESLYLKQITEWENKAREFVVQEENFREKEGYYAEMEAAFAEKESHFKAKENEWINLKAGFEERLKAFIALEEQFKEKENKFIAQELSYLEKENEFLLAEHSYEIEKEQWQQSIISVQEHILTLQQKCKPTVAVVDSEESVRLKRALAQAEGQYLQLRSQFAEKSAVLAQTRKDLFNTETQLLLLKRAGEIEIEESSAAVLARLEEKIALADQEMKSLEEEITSLEALISHILSQ